MNKRGQAFIFWGIMTFIMVWIAAVIMINPIKESIAWSREPAQLDCDNSSIPTGTKATCILQSWFLPYFFATALAVGASTLVGTKLYQG